MKRDGEEIRLLRPVRQPSSLRWKGRSESRPGSELSSFFRGTNFVTPNISRHGSLTLSGFVPAYYELSYGVRSSGGTIWGVSIRDQFGRRLANDPSTCFGSLTEAEAFLRFLNIEARADGP